MAWMIVLTGWLFYGLLIWVETTHPHPQKNPIADLQEGFKDVPKHWGFHLVMLIAIVLYAISWGYVRSNKKGKTDESDEL